ncbi:creatininase family protein, partial [Streptomyces sp. NPDC001193]
MSSLDGSAWPRYAAPGRPGVLVVPLGSTEQHGPHLPFTVDTEIAAALAGALERRRRGVVLAWGLVPQSQSEPLMRAGRLELLVPRRPLDVPL